MTLLNINKNESGFPGGKKHWTDVIKNSGSSDALVWRQPEEDFNANSTLIVMPGEEAIFIKGGVIEQSFDNGTYALSTENYPFISRIRNAFSGGVSTFSAVVYFIRKAHSAEILWGTNSPIQVRDKILGIATKIRARGSYKIQIANPSKFLNKLLSGNVLQQTQQELVDNYFSNEFQSKIKSHITQFLNEEQAELLGVESQIPEITDNITPQLSEVFEGYGVKLVTFSIAALDVDSDELRRRYDQIGMDAIEKMRNAQADKGVMNTLGNDWGRQQAANILSSVAINPGAGGIAAAGAGVGMGLAAGNAFTGMAKQMFAPMHPQEAAQSAPMQPSGRFVQKSAGDQKASPADDCADDPVIVLKKLKELLSNGLIEQTEYDAKKAEILSRM